MQVSYRREVLISTRQFENTRIAIELSDTVDAVNGYKITYERLRDAVNNMIVEEIAALECGERAHNEETRRDRIRKKYGL